MSVQWDGGLSTEDTGMQLKTGPVWSQAGLPRVPLPCFYIPLVPFGVWMCSCVSWHWLLPITLETCPPGDKPLGAPLSPAPSSVSAHLTTSLSPPDSV